MGVSAQAAQLPTAQPANQPAAQPTTQPVAQPTEEALPAASDVSLPPKSSLIFKVDSESNHLQMTVHSSRILMLNQKIAQFHAQNPDVLTLTALSPYQIQVAAKATGVTQVNLWGADQKEYVIDVIILGDAKELEMVLKSTFPTAAIKITPLAKSVLISGFVDKSSDIDCIIRIAEEYFPTVINHMTVGGVQQVLLHVKMMEVSRTKLRQFGMDFSAISGTQGLTTGVAGLLTPSLSSTSGLSTSGSGGTLAFTVGKSFMGVLDALREDKLMRILAEPTLVTISGRPAQFLSGGSFYIVPQGLAAAQPMQVKFGTQLDFVPIVLGNGKIHLDVRPHISQIDDSLSVQGYPGLLEQSTETGVELQAGQTLAIAGLVQSRTSAQNHGLPWISEVPYVGALFRTVKDERNDVELLILVTPEVVEPLNADEVPMCGPGMQTTSPSDWELFMKGHLEVPKCCPNQQATAGEGIGNGAGSPPPPAGMIPGNGETLPAPEPSDSVSKTKTTATASRTSSVGNSKNKTYNHYTPSDANKDMSEPSSDGSGNPPGIIGPVGYDVVK
jgi:pilus assembly protein CpaC